MAKESVLHFIVYGLLGEIMVNHMIMWCMKIKGME